MTKHLKQYALVVLTSWIIAWAIVIFEPCCASVLDETKRHIDHHAQAGHTDDHDHSTDHHAAIDSKSGSLHDCRVAVENLDDLTAPISTILFTEKTEDSQAIHFEYSQQLTFKTSRPFSYQHTHPPPGRHLALYLSTQRLRI